MDAAPPCGARACPPTASSARSKASSRRVPRWPGQYEDAETGLHYNRFRYYDPESGQYVSQDPIGALTGEPHGYVFDPSNESDPFGLARADKTPTSQLRELWEGFVGDAPTEQVHHGLPEELGDDFKKLGGLDVNDPRFFYDLPDDVHTRLPDGVHTNGNPMGRTWNAVWKDWLSKNRGRLKGMGKDKAADVIKRRPAYMAKRMGITDYRSTKVKACK